MDKWTNDYVKHLSRGKETSTGFQNFLAVVGLQYSQSQLIYYLLHDHIKDFCLPDRKIRSFNIFFQESAYE